MPKVKTHSGAKKRFKVTSSGNIKRKHAFMRHNLRKRSTKQKRFLSNMCLVKDSDSKRIKQMLNI